MEDISLCSRLEIHPLPWGPKGVAEPKNPPSQEISVAKKRRLNHGDQSVFGGASSNSIKLPSTSDSSVSIVDNHSKTVTSISPGYDNGLRHIQITSQAIGQREVTSCSVVKLPDNTCVQNINASLQTIENEDGQRVRVVLTPGSRTTYESDVPTVSKILPLVAHRDVSLLRSNAVKRKATAALMQDDAIGAAVTERTVSRQ
jgi:hypothetical protein